MGFLEEAESKSQVFDKEALDAKISAELDEVITFLMNIFLKIN